MDAELKYVEEALLSRRNARQKGFTNAQGGSQVSTAQRYLASRYLTRGNLRLIKADPGLPFGEELQYNDQAMKHYLDSGKHIEQYINTKTNENQTVVLGELGQAQSSGDGDSDSDVSNSGDGGGQVKNKSTNVLGGESNLGDTVTSQYFAYEIKIEGDHEFPWNKISESTQLALDAVEGYSSYAKEYGNGWSYLKDAKYAGWASKAIDISTTLLGDGSNLDKSAEIAGNLGKGYIAGAAGSAATPFVTPVGGLAVMFGVQYALDNLRKYWQELIDFSAPYISEFERALFDWTNRRNIQF